MPRLTWKAIEAMPVADYYGDVRRRLRPAMMFASCMDTRGFGRVLDPISYGIQIATGSPCGHVGILAPFGSDRWVVIHATWPQVKIEPLSWFVTGLDDGKPHSRNKRRRVLIYDPKPVFNRSIAWQWAYDRACAEYPWADLLKILKSKITGWNPWNFDPRRPVCSALVGQAYREGGHYIESKYGAHTPRELVDHPFMELRWRLT